MKLNNILSIILSSSLLSILRASSSDSEQVLCVIHNTVSSLPSKASSATSCPSSCSCSSLPTTIITTTVTSSETESSNCNLCVFNASKTKSSTSTSTSTSTGDLPTYQQFCDAVGAYNLTTAGGNPPTPSQDLYNSYCDNFSNVTMGEQAQFLANSIWETGGLQYMTELACNQSQCDSGNYYGRGFLQLSYDYNYQNASTAIYGDSSLYDNPDIAAENDGAWKTAMWYWMGYCRPSMEANDAVKNKALGYSVMQINGPLECGTNPSSSNAQNRLVIYNQILKIFGLGGTGTLTGCC